MAALSAAKLLDAWERGWAQPPIQRAIALAALALPETPLENLARLSLGERNANLLILRQQIFGSQMVSLTKCGACGEALELRFAVEDILLVNQPEATNPLVLRYDDYEVQFRLPNSEDLLAAMADRNSARQFLFDRCVLAAHYHGDVISTSQLPVEAVHAVEERMAQADPQADVQLNLACPYCGHHRQAHFDIVAFLWNEINAWACRLLRQVHVLASAYGWRESEILAMSPWRRQLYLEMIKA